MPEKFGSSGEPKNPQEGEAGKKEKVITLPNREEMLARLVKVSDKSQKLSEKLTYGLSA